jgi:hypothetical protein
MSTPIRCLEGPIAPHIASRLQKVTLYALNTIMSRLGAFHGTF